MKFRSVFRLVSIIAILGFYSCANDEVKPADDLHKDEVKVSTMPSQKVIVSNQESPATDAQPQEKETEVIEKNIKQDENISSQQVDKKLDKIEDNNTKIEVVEKEEPKEEIILSESLDLSSDRNHQINPDNANAPLDLEEGSNISLVPIFSADDFAKYYVVFKESPKKMNKKQLESLIVGTHKVFVANHLGLYKYSVGQSSTEEEAANKKKSFDHKQGNTNSQVVTFKPVW